MSAPAEEILAARDLTFRYDGKTILDGCSFSVRRSERLVIIGTSGSGKSTLLRLILGLIRPDSGSIRFEDHDIASLSPQDLNALRRRIGMVFQSAALISSLSVAENLALPLRELTDGTDEEIDRIVDEKLDLVGMRATKPRLPGELSGGMRKRVGLARALALEPEMILFDEPSAGLDPVAASVIDDLIVRLSKETSATCIVVTHNMDSAFRVGDRVAMLHQGKILAEGTSDEIRGSADPIVRQFVAGDANGPLSKEAEA
jgi:phospholipid/cholesterol/gamma-HCH transport system ATP-binding protein